MVLVHHYDGFMSNPARELHDLIKTWRDSIPGEGTLANALDPRTPEGSAQLVLFYSLSARCETLLLDLEVRGFPVALYRRQMINWVRIPLGLNGAWGKTVARDSVIPPDWLDQIEHLALYLDGKVMEFPKALLGDLDSIVTSGLELLADDDELPEPLRTYIHDLLLSIRTAISHQRVGLTFDFASATRNLYVAFTAAEARTGKRKQFWADLGKRIIFDGASNLAVSGTTAIATLAITSLN